mgnify:CR=1 FL=1
MSFVKVGMKRSITAVGRKKMKGRRMRSSVPNRSSTRVVSASTITAFIIEAPRMKGMTRDLTVRPPIPGTQDSIKKAQPVANAIIAAISA